MTAVLLVGAGIAVGLLCAFGALAAEIASGRLGAPRAPHGPHAGCCYLPDTGEVAPQHRRTGLSGS